MKPLVRSHKDFGAGLLYLAFGGAALWIGRNYPMGTAGRMGPGYFPAALAAVLVLIGAASLIRSFLQPGKPLGGFAWKSLAIVLAATASFGFLINTAGLVIALSVLVLVSAAASAKFRFDWRATLGLIGLVVFCSLVFVQGLGVPMPLLGSWFE